MRSTQSHYLKVAQGAIFMEQKMRFGLILGQLVIAKKKKWPIMSAFFSCFGGKKESFFFKSIVASALQS
jgi:hypothetical protein